MKLLKFIADKPLPKGQDIKRRFASRAIIFDKNNLIPILFVSKSKYHKLPGGGIERGENKLKALERELLEETGCTAKIKGEIGKVTEYRSQFKWFQFQTSYCYFGNVIYKGKPSFDKGEVEEGFRLIWMSLPEAISRLKKDKPINYEGKFIQKRDLAILAGMKNIVGEMG